MTQSDSHPSPPYPAIVQLYRWIREPFALLRDAEARLGDVFVLTLPAVGKLHVVSHPDAVKDVFALGPEVANAGEANGVLKAFLGRHSLLTLDGPEHFRHRKMMMPALHGDRMHAYGRSMLQLAHDAIDRFPEGRNFPVINSMQSITLHVILRSVFGVGPSGRFTELAEVMRRSLDLGSWPLLLFPIMQHDLGPRSPWGQYARVAARGRGILLEEIRRGRIEGAAKRDDVLALLLDAKDEHGNPLSEAEIVDELVTLLVAGHETTATALAWTLRWVLPDANLTARLRSEIATASDDPQKIGRLELLDATVKESLRLQPVVPVVARILKEPKRIGRHEFAARTCVAPAIYLMHRRPELYPDPETFRPDRFMTWKPTPWEWLPFGGGFRRCIGQAFAIYEMKMVLAALLGRVDARLVQKRVRPVRRSVTIAPEGGLPIVVTARRSRPTKAA